MKVDFLERLTTCVWTLTLPKPVRRAFGMRSASVFSSSGAGLSVTAGAHGGPKSIFAHASGPRPPHAAAERASSPRRGASRGLPGPTASAEWLDAGKLTDPTHHPRARQ